MLGPVRGPLAIALITVLLETGCSKSTPQTVSPHTISTSSPTPIPMESTKATTLARATQPTSQPSKKSAVVSLLEQGQSEIESMRYRNAIELLLRAKQLEPDNSEVQLALWNAYLKTEDFKSAVPYGKKFASLRPGSRESQEIAAILSERIKKEPKAQASPTHKRFEVLDGQQYECINVISTAVQMADCEWNIDSIFTPRSKEDDRYRLSTLYEVGVPKGMIVTVVRTRLYKGHTITKLRLEEPRASYSCAMGETKSGPIYSDVWVDDFATFLKDRNTDSYAHVGGPPAFKLLKP